MGKSSETYENVIENESYFVAKIIDDHLGSILMVNGDDCLEGWVGARGGEVKGCGVVLGVVKSSPGENPSGAIGVIGGELRGVEGGAV
ncbi:hypothetical protein Tco_0883017 [Tanacetum coccineum]